MTGFDWPAGFDRTPSGERSRNNRFQTSLSDAFDDLEAELGRLGVDEYRYSFDADQRKTDQRPYARASPDDPGFALRWTMDGDQFAVACDRYSRLRDNVRTTGLYLNEKRKMGNRPVETGESEFANARLPPGDAASEAVVGHEPPHDVLGVAPDAPETVIKGAARSLKKDAHPDNGGSDEEFKRVVAAEEAMLDE